MMFGASRTSMDAVFVFLDAEFQSYVVGVTSNGAMSVTTPRLYLGSGVAGGGFQPFEFMPQMSSMGDKEGKPINNKQYRQYGPYTGSNTP